MPIHLQFDFAFEDYLNGQYLAAKSRWWPRLNLVLARWVIPVIGVLNILLAFLISGSGISWALFSGLLGLGIFLTFYRVYYRFRLKGCYRRSLIGSGERIFDFSDAVIELQEANAKSEIQWAAIRFFSEDKKMFLLYLAPSKIIMIPKRVCTDQQLSELRELCRRNISTVPA